MTSSKQYTFQANIWKYDGSGGWHFVTVPKILSNKIRKNHAIDEEGWGRLKTIAKIGECEWKTSIWYDSKSGGYLLPIKASIRKSAGLKENTRVAAILKLQKPDSKLVRMLRP